MITFESSGDFKNTRSFLDRILRGGIFDGLDHFGQLGVDALSSATPRASGETAQSWGYRILRGKSSVTIEWYNTNVIEGKQIAILIQYGHGTGTGGYVAGRDFINPAMKPIFDKIIEDVWKKVNHG